MANFNPAIQPTNDPSYGANSRSIDVPDSIKPRGVEQNQILPKGQEIGDRSAEFEGKGLEAGFNAQAVSEKGYGDLFAGIAGIADFMGKAGVSMVNKDIENRVYNTVDETRKAYTAELENLKKGPGVANILNANASADVPETPDEIGHLSSTLDSLVAARDGGKISSTYYYGRLLSEAKDLRARYPGFREEIDAQFAKVSGVNPANAYITSLVGDINKAAASKSTETNKALTFVLQNSDLAGAPEMLKKIQTGEATLMDALTWAAPSHKLKADLQMNQLQLNSMKGTREELQTQAKLVADKAIAIEANNHIRKVLDDAGMGSEAQVIAMESRYKSGAMTGEQFLQAGQQLAQQKNALILRMVADADKSGLTTQVGGKAKLREIINDNMKDFDAFIDRVYNKDFGGMYSAANSIKVKVDEAQQKLLNDPIVGPPFVQMSVQKQIGGEGWMQKFNLNLLQTDLPENYKKYYENNIREMQSQVKASQTGTAVSLNAMFEDARKKGITEKKFYNGLMSQVNLISDKETPDAIKANVARTFFSPENMGFISKLNADGVDERGRPITGQFGVFAKFTTPEITAEMKRLGDKNPEIWKNYQDWAKNTFANELFNKEINQLNSDQVNQGVVKFAWDSDNKRFLAVDTRPKDVQDAAARARGGSGDEGNTYANTVKRSINKINAGIYNLKNVATASGTDVDTYLFNSMADAGLDIRNINGIPGKLVNAIIASRFNKASK